MRTELSFVRQGGEVEPKCLSWIVEPYPVRQRVATDVKNKQKKKQISDANAVNTEEAKSSRETLRVSESVFVSPACIFLVF